MKNKIIIITGPTGVGKTRSSITLAKKLDTEIISADSFQIYKYMDIGTDKISFEKQEGIPHHNLSIVKPDQEYNVVEFQKNTHKIIKNIHLKNKVPIIVGGTGLYLHSILYDMDFSGRKANNTVREKINNMVNMYGLDYIYDKLVKVDPNTYKLLDKNNRHRVIRAYEVFLTTGLTPSDTLNNFRSRKIKYDNLYIVLNENRDKLYANINDRVIKMIDEGLEDEIKSLVSKGYGFNLRSFKAIGYKEFEEYFKGKIELDEVIRKIQQHSRNYAKRQLTWFRREKSALWIDKDNFKNQDDLDHHINGLVQEFLNS